MIIVRHFGKVWETEIDGIISTGYASADEALIWAWREYPRRAALIYTRRP